ncbi:hypothetical protein CK203_049154 [Vitis vinifera]|uniref:Transposon Ty3-I Gag-Pol polyprotein n=1 Tax=Vitis vinifera TaxID=29760 RepID=A0A438GV85_VITVI|nr:hypothetical protein CK203_049154 [Vitis vinifera]
MCGVSWLTQAAWPTCQASVVSHMGHSLAGLENPGRILSGFNGSSTTSLGDIILPVQAGPVTLNVQFSCDPSGRKLGFHPDRQKVIRNEIDKLLEAGFIREVAYPDCFPLPRIDQIVDSTSGQGMLSFLDAFSGYHQIPMSQLTRKDSIHNATRPLLLQSHTVEVYIDDIVVKSKTRGACSSFTRSFSPLEEVWHEANPSKCAFGVSAGKFLGLWSAKGIEVSPDQVKAVMETPPPGTRRSCNASRASSCIRAFHSPLH